VLEEDGGGQEDSQGDGEGAAYGVSMLRPVCAQPPSLFLLGPVS
jgi:hypothetical protein